MGFHIIITCYYASLNETILSSQVTLDSVLLTKTRERTISSGSEPQFLKISSSSVLSKGNRKNVQGTLNDKY